MSLAHDDLPELRSRLDENVRSVADVRRDMAVLQEGQRQQGEMLSTIVKKIDTLATSANERGRYSIQDLASMMQVVVLGFALISGVVSGIVYISSNASSAEMALLKDKVRTMSDRLDRARP